MRFSYKNAIVVVLATTLLLVTSSVLAFQTTTPAPRVTLAPTTNSVLASQSHLFSATAGTGEVSASSSSQLTQKQVIRQEGGALAFKTKFGALNHYAIYYGLLAIFLGVPWFIALKSYQLLQILTRNRFDRLRRIPSFLNHVWGVTLMRLTRSYPVIVNEDILKDFYKENRPAMFVANHCSWMDIPFMGATIGWRNYKFVAKQELEKVPILSAAIQIAGNLMVDRKDKRSGLKTLRTGIDYMKDGLHLCTFPEGTRSRDGRLKEFKNGAFKMAHKAGAPVIPLSIVGAQKVQPIYWMFPMMASRRHVKVVVHKPVESKSVTEDELAKQVRAAMVEGLPDDQKPLEKN